MKEPHLGDVGQIHDDPEHWDALAAHVASVAARASRRGALDWLASSRAGWVAACLLGAAVLTLLMLPLERSPRARDRDHLNQILAPSDDVGQAIVVRDSPPPIGALLLNRTTEVTK
jgi:hypothetical protein